MTTSTVTSKQNPIAAWLKGNLPLLILVVVLAALPFVIGLANGDSIGDVLANESGNSKFIQGLLIEVFILAVFAISYDLVLGISGLLSFGHAMFFAVGAYLTGVLLKSFGWTLLPTIGAVILAGIVQAALFAIVLPRVKGITFALVTLGMASVFSIMIGTRELAEYTGADVGLQGIPRPALLGPVAQLRFYFIALAFTVLVYRLYRRFVDSPTGRVCIAIRENEGRARMLGFNTFYFKLAALIVASVTAALAGLLHALYKPIVSPEIAHMGYTVDALLIILIGGMGTLSGAMIGAALYRLLDFYLFKWFGETAGFLLGALYVAFVLFALWHRRHLAVAPVRVAARLAADAQAANRKQQPYSRSRYRRIKQTRVHRSQVLAPHHTHTRTHAHQLTPFPFSVIMARPGEVHTDDR